jgi:hypothetical protein
VLVCVTTRIRAEISLNLSTNALSIMALVSLASLCLLKHYVMRLEYLQVHGVGH